MPYNLAITKLTFTKQASGLERHLRRNYGLKLIDSEEIRAPKSFLPMVQATHQPYLGVETKIKV